MLCASGFSPLLMDRSASIRVAPEPCRSGDIEIPGNSPGNSGDVFRQHYPSLLIPASGNAPLSKGLQAMLQQYYPHPAVHTNTRSPDDGPPKSNAVIEG
jgi:hypothetical protein